MELYKKLSVEFTFYFINKIKLKNILNIANLMHAQKENCYMLPNVHSHLFINFLNTGDSLYFEHSWD